jgi:hypothetical protein
VVEDDSHGVIIRLRIGEAKLLESHLIGSSKVSGTVKMPTSTPSGLRPDASTRTSLTTGFPRWVTMIYSPAAT